MIPKDWTLTSLGCVSSIVTKGATPTTYGYDFVEKSSEAVMFLGAYNCSSDGNFKSDSLKWISQDADDMLKRSRLMAGDCIFCIVGNTIGSSFIVDKDILPANINQNIALIRAIKSVAHPQYMHYCLRSSYIQWQVKQEASTQAQPSLGLKQVSDFRITLPPIDEQLKITEIISTWDKAIATTEQLLANSQQQKKALMQQLLTGRKRLSGFDELWAHSNLKLIVNFSKGQQINRNTLTTSGEFPVINGGVGPSGYTNQYNGLPNTITISEGGNSCGYVSFQKKHFWCGGHCYALANLNVDVEFMYHLLKFNETKIMRLRVGSGLPNIQKKDLEAFSIYYPLNMHEQKKIANILSVLDQETEALQKKLHYLKQEKKALMQQLLTGKRRVKVEAA